MIWPLYFNTPVMILRGECYPLAWRCVEIKKLMLALFNIIYTKIIILCTICTVIKCSQWLLCYWSLKPHRQNEVVNKNWPPSQSFPVSTFRFVWW